MKMGINDILVHYEELGGIDIRVRITMNLIVDYYMDCGFSWQSARSIAIEKEDHEIGWAMVMDDDEAFYIWCKRKRFKKAKEIVNNKAKLKFLIYWLDKASKTVRLKTKNTFSKAMETYDEIARGGHQVAVYVKKGENDPQAVPIRKKNNPVDLLPAVAKLLGKEEETEERTICMKTRAVRSCSECLRYWECKTKEKQE